MRCDPLIRQDDVAVDRLPAVTAAGTRNDDADACQPNRVGAHDARFDAGVQRAAGQIAGPSPRKRRAQRLHLCVSGRVKASTHRFDTFGHEFVTVNNQGANRTVATLDRLAREVDAATHLPLVLWAH